MKKSYGGLGGLFLVLSVIGVRCQPSIDLDVLQPNAENDDMHPVNFYLTTNDEKQVIAKLICKGWQCPDYVIENDHSAFVQERVYPPFQVMSAIPKGCDNFTENLYAGYSALFRYRKGLNSENKTINMSVPVIVEVTKESESGCKERYKVFYLAKGNGSLPAPVEANVKIEDTPTLSVYVHTFTGFFDKPTQELAKLIKEVRSLKLCFNEARYFVAMYDTPWQKYGRRNEIWVDAIPCDKE